MASPEGAAAGLPEAGPSVPAWLVHGQQPLLRKPHSRQAAGGFGSSSRGRALSAAFCHHVPSDGRRARPPTPGTYSRSRSAKTRGPALTSAISPGLTAGTLLLTEQLSRASVTLWPRPSQGLCLLNAPGSCPLVPRPGPGLTATLSRGFLLLNLFPSLVCSPHLRALPPNTFCMLLTYVSSPGKT